MSMVGKETGLSRAERRESGPNEGEEACGGQATQRPTDLSAFIFPKGNGSDWCTLRRLKGGEMSNHLFKNSTYFAALTIFK